MGTALYIGDGRDDVRRRLTGSICRYKGVPVYVHNSALEIVYLQYLDKLHEKRFPVDHRDPEFDYRSPPLGYANYQDYCVYLYRVPDRQNAKAGIASENLASEGTPIAFPFPHVCLRDCILGVYPSFDDAVTKVAVIGDESCAFSRHFAVGRFGRGGVALYHRGRAVGLRESGRFRLMEGQDSSILERLARKAGVKF